MGKTVHNFVDLKGQKFGELTVIEKAPKDPNIKSKQTRWLCSCSCGNTHIVGTQQLKNGKSKWCKECSEKAKPKNNMIGNTFGDWTVLSEAPQTKNKSCQWNCICKCGTQKILSTASLIGDRHNRCIKCHFESQAPDLKGKIFGAWTVLEIVRNENEKILWRVKCICGDEHLVGTYMLVSGKSTKCQKCRFEEMTSHGMTKSKLYHVWSVMKQRILKEYSDSYKNYGGRGLKISDEWLEFEPFYKWAMESGYKEGLTIERKCNDIGYFPDNCTWATKSEQANNKRTNRLIKYQNETKTLKQWCDILNKDYNFIHGRLSKGWSFERAITEEKRRW